MFRSLKYCAICRRARQRGLQREPVFSIELAESGRQRGLNSPTQGLHLLQIGPQPIKGFAIGPLDAKLEAPLQQGSTQLRHFFFEGGGAQDAENLARNNFR